MKSSIAAQAKLLWELTEMKYKHDEKDRAAFQKLADKYARKYGYRYEW